MRNIIKNYNPVTLGVRAVYQPLLGLTQIFNLDYLQGAKSIGSGLKNGAMFIAETGAVHTFTMYNYNLGIADLYYAAKPYSNSLIEKASPLASCITERTTSFLTAVIVELVVAAKPYYEAISSLVEPYYDVALNYVNLALNSLSEAVIFAKNIDVVGYAPNIAGLTIATGQLFSAIKTFKNFNELEELGVESKFNKYSVVLAELSTASVTALQTTGLYTFSPLVVMGCIAGQIIGHYMVNSFIDNFKNNIENRDKQSLNIAKGSNKLINNYEDLQNQYVVLFEKASQEQENFEDARLRAVRPVRGAKTQAFLESLEKRDVLPRGSASREI